MLLYLCTVACEIGASTRLSNSLHQVQRKIRQLWQFMLVVRNYDMPVLLMWSQDQVWHMEQKLQNASIAIAAPTCDRNIKKF